MQDGGSIQILCRNRLLGESEIAELDSGPYVHLEVRDTGSGIAPEHIDTVFAP